MSEDYTGKVPDDFDPYRFNKEKGGDKSYDPSWDFELKERGMGNPTSINTRRLIRRHPK